MSPLFSWVLNLKLALVHSLERAFFAIIEAMNELAQDKRDSVEERIQGLVEETLQGSALYLVSVDVRGRKGSRVVEIFLDSDGVLDVEELARVSREVGFLLDTEDVIEGRYSLNVSSPGVDRPLALPRQYKKNVGRQVRVKYRTNQDADVATVEGALKEATDEGIAIAVSPSNTVEIAFDEVVETRVLLPW